MDIPDNVCRTKSYAVHVNDFYIYDMIDPLIAEVQVQHDFKSLVQVLYLHTAGNGRTRIVHKTTDCVSDFKQLNGGRAH